MRLLSAISSTLTVFVFYQLGKRLFDKQLALVAAFLLAINPFHIIFAQEARMYTLFTLFSLLSAFYFWQAWHGHALQREQKKEWIYFTVVTILAFYTHSLAFLNLLALNCFALLQFGSLKKQWKPWLMAHLAIVVAFFPWAFVILQQTTRLGSEFVAGTGSPLMLLTAVYLFLFGTALPAAVAPIALIVSVTLIAFALLGLRYRQRADSEPLLFVGLLFLVPVVGLFIISFIQPIFVERRLLPASLGLYLFVAWGIVRANPRKLNMALGTLLGGLMSMSLFAYYANPAAQKIPMREVVEAVSEQIEDGDTIIHATDTSALAFILYAPTLPNHFLAGDPDYLAGTNRGRAQRIAGLIPVERETAVFDKSRIWLIITFDHNIEYQQQKIAEFDTTYIRSDTQNVGGVDIILYTIP